MSHSIHSARNTGLKSCFTADGGWSEWTPLTLCTKTCESGTLIAVRKCTYPKPLLGGNPCPGSDNEIKVCNPQICPGELPQTIA